MQTILHHNSSGAAAYTGRLKKREVHRAITLHPVKDHRHMYRLHTYFKSLKIQDLRESSLDLHRDIAASVKELGVNKEQVADYVLPGDVPLFPTKMGMPGYLGDNRILGTEIRELPMGEPAPFEDPEILEKINSKTNLNDYEDFDEDPSPQTAGFLDFGKLNVKEAIENGLLKLQNNLPNVFKWSDDDYEYPIYDRRIHFILPLLGRQEIFVRFMKNYEDIVLMSDEAVSLIVVMYLDSKNPLDYRNAEALIDHYNDLYGKDIKIVHMGSTTFSRGAAITEGIKVCADEDLMFFIDVDMMFNHITLRRIRISTIRYNQVYFPIVFSEYNPEVVNGEDFNKLKNGTLDTKTDTSKHVENSVDNVPRSDRESADLKYTKEINDDYGYFRQYGFGILSIFKCDFHRVGGFDLNIKGWGLEDVEFFETLIKSNLTVYRIADDSLVHKFHSVDCDKNLEKSQFLMCLGTKASTYGSEKHMTYYLLNHPEILWPRGQGGNEKGVS
ncbi:unnamed protein product [Leptidea sinapis]|uniref:Hexosyltransferase n=1 Tax=Leptidea sinapis TaxID=189913 RepID=A0A5E4QKF3_9NEOP|nr:unnamed protein product [Leptidea sinapis]